MERLGRRVCRALACALGQPAEQFDAYVTPHPEVLVKVIRYPGADGADRQGVGRHRDTGFVTFVLQDDGGGLQVRLDDRWIDVPAIPGAFVVNLGEMMQLLTSGYFAATVHRVISPPAGHERVSVAYFFNPKLEATLTPLTLPPELARDAPGGESNEADNPIFANYGANSMKVRLRAHPDVAQRHHTDLLD
jgi:isopenicillin N synthase-like dioxygenase